MAIDFKTNLSTNRIATHATPDKKPVKVEQAASQAESVHPIESVTKVTGERQGSPSVEERNHPNSESDVKEAVGRVSGYVQNVQRDLLFSVDDNSGKTIISVVDSETNQLVRQIPPEEIVRLSEQLDQIKGGVLFKDEA